MLTAGVSQFVLLHSYSFQEFGVHPLYSTFNVSKHTILTIFMDILLADLQLRGNPSISEHMPQCSVQAIKNKNHIKFSLIIFITILISPSRSRLSVPMIATAFKKKLFEISQK